jgi:hypothetical protein
MDCPICLDVLDTEDQVSCLHCDVAVCKGCFKNYLLSREHDISCHSCNKPWSEDFIDEQADDKFRNGALRQHRTKFLVDQEEARLPGLQDRARRYKLASVKKRSKPYYVRDMLASFGLPIRDWGDSAAALALYGPGWARGTARSPAKVILRACPSTCRGFLDQEGKCGMCAKQVCLKCHETLDSTTDSTPKVDHKCDPAAVATVRLLAKETKPCPTCHAPIFKIDGCDQMWCTLCQTPFSWATGLKETGRVHNPHYYEWMRRTNGSVPRENECQDGQLRYWNLRGDNEVLNLLQGFHRVISMRVQYNRPPANNEEALNRIGVKYLAGDIPKQEWARRVYIEKRQQKRLQAEYDISRAFAVAASDIMNAFLDEPTADAKVTAKSIADLMVYMQECLERTYDRYFYKGNGDSIIPDWSVITNGINYDTLSEICSCKIDRYLPAPVDSFIKFVDWITGN